MSDGVAVTRVVNACALIEVDGVAVLTDPYFERRWFMRMREPIGLRVEQLPRLAAIIGGHGVFDHWQPASMGAYPYKRETPVFVATKSMARAASSAGFSFVELVDWGARRQLSAGVTIEVSGGEVIAGLRTNHYVISGSRRVFVGTEARSLPPLRSAAPVDVAILPIDGSSLLGRPLVMNTAQALDGARVLGAKVLIPFHYALRPLWPLLTTPGTLGALLQAQRDASLELVCLCPGERWSTQMPKPAAT